MHLRPAGEDDAAAVAAVYAPYVSDSVVSFEDVPPDAAEIRRRMLVAPRLPWLVAIDEGVVGFAYAAPHRTRAAYRWSVDVSVYLHASARGRGIGRALYGELFPLLSELGYVSAFAGIALPNPASIALHESFGFVPVGTYRDVGFKHGRWHDVGWWQRGLGELPDVPEEPTGWISPAQR